MDKNQKKIFCKNHKKNRKLKNYSKKNRKKMNNNF